MKGTVIYDNVTIVIQTNVHTCMGWRERERESALWIQINVRHIHSELVICLYMMGKPQCKRVYTTVETLFKQYNLKPK